MRTNSHSWGCGQPLTHSCEPPTVGSDVDLTYRGCGVKLGLVYAVSPSVRALAPMDIRPPAIIFEKHSYPLWAKCE